MKNCLKYFVFSFFFAFLFLPSKVDAFSGSGSGIEASPYVITTCSQLQEMQDDLDGYYVLGNDIDCTASSGWSWANGTGFRPIGGYWDGTNHPAGATVDSVSPYGAGAPVYSFTGVLDGQDYTISNIFENVTVPYGGLFGSTNGAVLKNFTLLNSVIESVYVYGQLSAFTYDTDIINVDVVLDLGGTNASASYMYCGGMIGIFDDLSTITDSTVTGTLGDTSDVSSSVGGFVGLGHGDISISNSSADFTGSFGSTYGLGGIIGTFDITDSGNLSMDYVTSSVDFITDGASDVGGLVGTFEGSDVGVIDITNSEFDGTLTAVNGFTNFGGFIGSISDDSTVTISESSSSGTIGVTGGVAQLSSYVGNHGGTLLDINNSTLSGTVTVNASVLDVANVGGIVGLAQSPVDFSYDESLLNITVTNADYARRIGSFIGSTISTGVLENSSESGNISITSDGSGSTPYAIGGLAGLVSGDFDINNSYYSGTLTSSVLGMTSWGGIVGDADSGSINDSVSRATLNGSSTTDSFFGVGGVVGTSDGEVNGSVSLSNITLGDSLTSVGGIAGEATLITNSFSDSTLNLGNSAVLIGGIAGQVTAASNSYADGSIIVADDSINVGGGVGYLNNSTITNLYSNTDISVGTGAQYTGGLIGFVNPADVVTSVSNSYWNITNSGVATSDGGTGYTDAQMKVQGNFSGWDFSTLWDIDSSINGGYPYFADSLNTYSLSQNGSSTYAQSYDTDITFGGSWSMNLVRYQWSTSTTPNPSNWTEITSYTGIQTPADTTGVMYLHIDYENLLGFGDSVVSGAFLLDNTNPTIAYSQNTDAVTVNVSDNDSGIAIFQYFWSQSQSVPSSGWISSTEGSSIDKPTETGTWYLHTKSIDNAGNLVLGISDAVVVSTSTTPAANTPSTTTPDETDSVTEEETDDLDEANSVDINEEENKDDDLKVDTLDTILDSAEDRKTFMQVTKEILSIMDENPVAKNSILATGVASSVLILAPSFWLNLSIGIWERLLGLFGVFVRKKEKRTGVVYDSVTKEPVKLAIIRFFDKEDKLITTEVTDAMGAYYLDYEGEYRMEVSANRYSFPSKIISGKDSSYSNIYTGGYVTEKEASIPVDMKENGVIRSVFVFLSNKVGLLWSVVCWILFILGFSLVLYDLTVEITNLSLILFGIYIFLLLTSFISLKKKYGSVISAYGDVLSGYKVRLENKELESISYERITNEEGKYKFVVPDGNYQLQVLNRNGDVVFNKDIFDVKSKDGLISIVEDIVI